MTSKTSFMKYFLIAFTLMFISSGLNAGTFGSDGKKKDKEKKEELSADGPYVLYQPDGKTRVISVDKKGKITDTTYVALPEDFTLHVVDHKGRFPFDVKLHPVKRPDWQYRQPEKVFVMSDPHGRLDCVISLLQGNGVIDKNYNWSFGSNHLMVIGDIFDRGADVLPILWLIYKLEFEAKTVGGRVTTILGDHEEMIMRDNLKYTYAKYNTLSQRAMNMTYGKMWGLTNVMGNWLRSKNTIQIVGENLYVHAGLSKAFMEREETIPEINELVSKSIYLSKEERKKQYPDIADFLYSDSYNGPLWYRGMVKTGSDYSPIKEADVDKLLAEYDVKRIIIGHTENSRVKYTYNKKVYDICVNHPKAFEKETRAVVIEGDDIKAINDEGELVTIKK